MRNAATASLLSTAVMLSSGCDEPVAKHEKPDPIRLATYRSLGARDHLKLVCGRPAAEQDRRFDQLKQFAAQKKAGQSVWLGENDRNAVARYAAPSGAPDCAQATADYRRQLDQLADAIAGHRE